MEPAKKLHVFHQRYFGKSANILKHSAPAEYPVIATPHSQQNPGVMRKVVRQSINGASRQANPEVTANNIWVMQYPRNFIQTAPR
jgi:hypothetical protein